MVNTQYILHSERIYYLYNGNPNFIHESISILEEKKNVHQVWFRKIENFGGEKEEIEKPILLTSNSIKYRMWPTTPQKTLRDGVDFRISHILKEHKSIM